LIAKIAFFKGLHRGDNFSLQNGKNGLEAPLASVDGILSYFGDLLLRVTPLLEGITDLTESDFSSSHKFNL
jgi:hypothetical protein